MHFALVLLLAFGAAQPTVASDSSDTPNADLPQQVEESKSRKLEVQREGASGVGELQARAPHAPSAIAPGGTTFSSHLVPTHGLTQERTSSNAASPAAAVAAPRGAIYALTIANHSSAVFDAWATRRLVEAGGRELNPLLKPMAGSNALYPTMQIWPTVVDVVAMKMRNSGRPWVRRLWWVPQLASTTTFVAAGVNNLNHYRRTVSVP